MRPMPKTILSAHTAKRSSLSISAPSALVSPSFFFFFLSFSLAAVSLLSISCFISQRVLRLLTLASLSAFTGTLSVALFVLFSE